MNVRYDGGICEYISLIVVRTSSCLTILVSKSLRLLLRTQTNEGGKKTTRVESTMRNGPYSLSGHLAHAPAMESPR